MTGLSTDPNLLRLPVFIGLLLLFLGIEHLTPARPAAVPTLKRRITNLGMSVINTVTVKLLGPLTAVGAAAWAADQGWGLLRHISLSDLWACLIACVILDLAIWAQHLATHKIPVLWRLHKVHHADRDVDTTTAIRFHPVEIILSVFYKGVIVLILGPSIVAVIAFEIILNGSALFNHMNVRLPAPLEKGLRRLIVTPDMHRIHHSVRPEETDSNYGFCLSVWDRMFGTYIAVPKAGHEAMQLGLKAYQTSAPSRLGASLKIPFK